MTKHIIFVLSLVFIITSQLNGQVLEYVTSIPNTNPTKMACIDQYAGDVSLGEVVAQSKAVSLSGPIFLCYQDRFTINNTQANLTGDPNASTLPGVGYGFFDCPPTATGPTIAIVEADPCVLNTPAPPTNASYNMWVYTDKADGTALFQNGNQINGMTIPEFFNGGDPVQIYFAPMTFDNFESNQDEDGGACFNLNAAAAFPVVYLNEIKILNCQVQFVNNEYVGSFVIEGGYPEYNGSTYSSVAVFKNNFSNQAAITGGPFMHGDVVTFIANQPGTYQILVEDGISCGAAKSLIIQEIEKKLTLNINVPAGPYNPGDFLCVPFCVQDFDTITSMEFTINFNPNVLQFNSILPGPLEALTTANFVDLFANKGNIPFSWFQPAATGVTIADGNCIFDICFDVIGEPGECSPIFLDGTPTSINVGCCLNDLPVELIYNSGEVCLSPPSNVVINAGTCGANNSNNGSITFSFIGGTAPYTYSSPCFLGGVVNSANQEITKSNLPAGNCTINVTDATGNMASIVVNVDNSSPIDYELFTVDPTCYGVKNGKIAIRNITGGSPDYYLSWSGGFFDVDSLQALAAGTYFVTITDDNDCEVEQAVVIGVDPIIVDIIFIDTTSCITSNDGQILAVASGGTPVTGDRYIYQWNKPSLLETNVITSINSNIPEGIGNVKVTDKNGCSVTVSYNMPIKKTVTGNAVITQPACEGDLGSIVLTGGTTNNSCNNFSFKWGNGLITANNQTTSSATNLAAGNYFVTITDCDGCELDTMYTIDAPKIIDIPFLVDFDCTQPTGCITLFPGGVTFPIMYTWSDDTTINSGNRCGLSPGQYNVIVTDANGCSKSTDISISQGGNIAPDTFFVTPISCAGDEDGIITVDIPSNDIVTYTWSGPLGGGYPNSETISGLSAGWYYVEIEDANGCIALDSVELIAPDTIFLNPNLTLPNCNGEKNATIALVVTGGDNTNGYIYSWNNFPSVLSPVLTNVFPGSYEVTIFDSQGCSKDTSIVIPDQEIINISVNVIQEVPCFGESSGVVQVNMSGGKTDNGNYGVIWSSGENENLGSIVSDTAFALMAGMNSVIVFDEECADTLNFNLTQPPPITVDLLNTELEDVSCYGECDGTVLIEAQGGAGNFSYNWPNLGTSNQLITDLCSEWQIVEIMDANGCVVLDSVFLNQPDSLVLFIDIFNTFNPACNNEGDGIIGVDYTGGNQGPVSYIWTDNVSDDARATGLSNGFYQITITDLKGCTDTTSFTLTSPPPIFAEVPTPVEPICFGDKTCISVENAIGGTGLNYRFSINNSNLFDIDSCIQVFAGEFLITVYDSDGCSYDTTLVINQPSELLASLGNDIIVELGDSVTTIEVQLNQNFVIDSIIWNSTESWECFNDDCTKIFIYPTQDTEYTVIAIDEDGCIASDGILIRLDDERKVYVPNIFTPNGDGINDVFQFFTGKGVVKILEFRVYDRWGNKMFEENNLSPNGGGTIGWDGTFNGQSLDSGVYAYYAQISFIDGKIIPYSGSITLVK